MRIGVLSDSHGDAKITRRAIELLERGGATFFIHCGDLCGQAVLDELVGRPCAFVWGNCDDPSPSTRAYLKRVGLTWPEAPLRLTLDGKQIAVCHGHEAEFRWLFEDSSIDYLFHGHTHAMRDDRRGKTRIINPGALFRARPHSVALLDTANDLVTFFEVETGLAITL